MHPIHDGRLLRLQLRAAVAAILEILTNGDV
jgi:hypothetical protein